MHIIIKGKSRFGQTRSEQEVNLRKEGFIGMSDENLDKCKWLEKKLKKRHGADTSFLRQTDISKVE